MAAELVETNQLWARRVVAIQPEWAEPLAQHLVKRSYSEPWWDAGAGRAVIAETVTLFGLPIVSNRMVGLDRVDRRLAREMFVRHALVFGDWETRHEFVARNDQFVERVRLLEARVRRIDLLDDEGLFEFYDERVGRDVSSARHFDRWWRDLRESDPDLLDLTPAVLSNRRGIDLADYPDTWRPHGWKSGDAEYPDHVPLRTGTALDGAALSVPLTALNQLDDTGFDWLIPGYRPELVALLVRSLPKDVRRNLIPMNETAAAATERLGPVEGRLVDALGTRRHRGVRRADRPGRLRSRSPAESPPAPHRGGRRGRQRGRCRRRPVGDSRSAVGLDTGCAGRRLARDRAPRHREVGHRPARPGRRASWQGRPRRALVPDAARSGRQRGAACRRQRAAPAAGDARWGSQAAVDGRRADARQDRAHARSTQPDRDRRWSAWRSPSWSPTASRPPSMR